MILKRALKQVMVVGVLALAYLQQASCVLTKSDIEGIERYWTERIAYFGTEITLRCEFFAKVRTFNSNDLALNLNSFLKKKMETEKTSMDAIMEEFHSFEEKADRVIKVAHQTLLLYKFIDDPNFSSGKEEAEKIIQTEIKANEKDLKELITSALDISTLLAKKINKYDSHMIEVVEESFGIRKEDIEQHNLALFKLAKSKIVAADIIYTLAETNPSDLRNDNRKKEVVAYLHGKISASAISKNNVELFVNAIRKDVMDKDMNLVLSGSRHFYLLFNICPAEKSSVLLADDETMDLYASLLKENISEEEVKEHTDITYVQVMKIIVIEYIMSGHLMDYKSNTMLRNLGRVIESTFDPTEYNKTGAEGFRIEQSKQDEIIWALHYIWGDYSSSCRLQRTTELCRKIGISSSEFYNMHSNFLSVKWMYEGAMAPSAGSDAQNTEDLAVPLDMSYAHPAWYVCRRCKYISHSNDDRSSNFSLFSEEKPGKFTFRPHAIKATDNELVWAKYMKDCIEACFSGCIRVIKREKDGAVYSRIVDDFYRSLNVCHYKDMALIIN
ncbi:hypothetical protein NEMIN01_1005 [Nematocida minor]|uniref:uncharacterized protein n=1 Tax=Nematocida minor TaxID=1912983 RepID=UPI00221F76B1|nr:uncharacterized protein NEMIN01_1005 [Nematocida minor]KAI5190381.1 hypothetical protein NEMIN01_1005 [Nematocida minor]